MSDVTLPTITCADTQAVADINCRGQIPNFINISNHSDNCNKYNVSQSVRIGDQVNVGEHQVLLTAMDDSGNLASCTSKFTLLDETKPIISVCPQSSILVADQTCQNVIPDLTDSTAASDTCTSVNITQYPLAASDVQIGNTTVTISAEDGNGNVATCVTIVSVIDTTSPSVICPNRLQFPISSDCDDFIPDLISYANVSDNCEVVSIMQNPSNETVVTKGIHIVNITAYDAYGNSADCSIEVELYDNTIPTIHVCPSSMTVQ